jgi:hypothetical protein
MCSLTRTAGVVVVTGLALVAVFTSKIIFAGAVSGFLFAGLCNGTLRIAFTLFAIWIAEKSRRTLPAILPSEIIQARTLSIQRLALQILGPIQEAFAGSTVRITVIPETATVAMWGCEFLPALA